MANKIVRILCLIMIMTGATAESSTWGHNPPVSEDVRELEITTSSPSSSVIITSTSSSSTSIPTSSSLTSSTSSPSSTASTLSTSQMPEAPAKDQSLKASDKTFNPSVYLGEIKEIESEPRISTSVPFNNVQHVRFEGSIGVDGDTGAIYRPLDPHSHHTDHRQVDYRSPAYAEGYITVEMPAKPVYYTSEEPEHYINVEVHSPHQHLSGVHEIHAHHLPGVPEVHTHHHDSGIQEVQPHHHVSGVHEVHEIHTHHLPGVPEVHTHHHGSGIQEAHPHHHVSGIHEIHTHHLPVHQNIHSHRHVQGVQAVHPLHLSEVPKVSAPLHFSGAQTALPHSHDHQHQTTYEFEPIHYQHISPSNYYHYTSQLPPVRPEVTLSKPDTQLLYLHSHRETQLMKTRKSPYKYYQPNDDIPIHYIEQGHAFPTQQTRVSPWKKLIHLIGAFLPFGLLLAALRPNVRIDNNTTQPNIVLSKWRGVDLPLEHKQDVDDICEDRSLCEIILSGSAEDAELIPNILWNFAVKSTDAETRENGLEEIFTGVKKKDCSSIRC